MVSVPYKIKPAQFIYLYRGKNYFFYDGFVHVFPAFSYERVFRQELVVKVLVASLASDNLGDWDCLHSDVNLVLRL